MMSDNPPSRRETSIALTVCIAVVLGCLALKWLVLGNIPHGSDAISYHFQARLFAAGRIHSPPAPLPEFFEMAMIAVRPDTIRFSIYPPGWPALLAMAMLAGCAPLANALMAGFCAFLIWLIATELFGRVKGWIALALAALSPFFMFMGASYTAHMSCAAALAATLFALLHSIKAASIRRALLWGVAAGTASGIAMLIRPYSALLGTIGAVWICACGVSWNPRKWIAPVAGACISGGAAILAFLAYNNAQTGSPWLTGYRYAFPNLSFLGFHGTESPSIWHNIAKNLPWMIRSLSKETWGWFVPDLWAAVAAVALTFKSRKVWAFAGAAAIFFIGQSAYFYFDLYYGPRFVFETFPWIAILSAAGIARFWRVAYLGHQNMLARKAARIFLLITLLSGICIGFPFFWRYYSANYCGHSPKLVGFIQERNLQNAGVFLKSLGQFEYGSVMPLNDLDAKEGDVVFARYIPERIEEFMNEYPRDEYWILEFNVLEAAGARNAGPDHFDIDSIQWIPIAPASQEVDSQNSHKENHQ